MEEFKPFSQQQPGNSGGNNSTLNSQENSQQQQQGDAAVMQQQPPAPIAILPQSASTGVGMNMAAPPLPAPTPAHGSRTTGHIHGPPPAHSQHMHPHKHHPHVHMDPSSHTPMPTHMPSGGPAGHVTPGQLTSHHMSGLQHSQFNTADRPVFPERSHMDRPMFPPHSDRDPRTDPRTVFQSHNSIFPGNDRPVLPPDPQFFYPLNLIQQPAMHHFNMDQLLHMASQGDTGSANPMALSHPPNSISQ